MKSAKYINKKRNSKSAEIFNMVLSSFPMPVLLEDKIKETLVRDFLSFVDKNMGNSMEKNTGKFTLYWKSSLSTIVFGS